MGQVRGPERDGGGQIRKCSLDRLLGQRIHQVQVEIRDRGGAQLGDRHADLLGSVDAAEDREPPGVEGLRPQRHTVDARRGVALEAAMLDRARVGLHGDLDIRSHGQPGSDAGEQGADRLRAEQGGRTPAEKHAGDCPACGKIEVGVEVGQQGQDVGLLGNPLRAPRVN